MATTKKNQRIRKTATLRLIREIMQYARKHNADMKPDCSLGSIHCWTSDGRNLYEEHAHLTNVIDTTQDLGRLCKVADAVAVVDNHLIVTIPQVEGGF